MTRLIPFLLGLALAAPAAAHQDRARPVPAPPLATTAERAVAAAAERWDLPAAKAGLASLGGTETPARVFLRANLAFLDGDYEEAARIAAGLPPAFGADPVLGPHLRLFAATREMRARLASRESEHFVLWHDPERDWVLVEPALEALEASWRAHGGWLGERPERKVRVEIVPSAEDFERVSSLTRQEIETSGAIGICKFNKVLLLSPRLLLRGYPWRDALSHEYLHYLLVRLTANRAPIWLQEGVARYGEALWRSGAPAFLEDVDRSLIARALREDALIGFDAMDPSLVRLPSMGAVRLAYAQCALAVEYLLERWGADGLRRVLAALGAAGEYRGMDPVLRAALGVPLAGFEQGWRDGLAAKGFVETPGIVVPSYRLADAAAGAEEWDLAEWQGLAAQNHLRLGDMLRSRGRAAAGLAEYERARGSAPASPYVHVKIARARLELGRAAEAAEAAREGVRLAGEYPAARIALAEALAALGDLEGAAAALRAALEVNPFDPNAWAGLATALGGLGRQEEGRRARATAARLAGAGAGPGGRAESSGP